jgi:hypothetical protein
VSNVHIFPFYAFTRSLYFPWTRQRERERARDKGRERERERRTDKRGEINNRR